MSRVAPALMIAIVALFVLAAALLGHDSRDGQDWHRRDRV